jgi:replicative DNA helicase
MSGIPFGDDRPLPPPLTSAQLKLLARRDEDEDPSLTEANPFHETQRNGDRPAARTREHRTLDGWAFVSAASDTVDAAWGERDAVLWAKGEPLMIVGPDGVGKTSIGQQIALARLLGGVLLGLPVSPAEKKVLYLAADRPSQAARSMRRMVNAADEDMLRDGLIVHRGPPPFDIIKDPVWTLAEWVAELGASDLIIDSLKDLAPELSKDETGSAVNRAFQEATASGLELCVLHHQRKQQPGAPPPKRLSDVYGSRWLTAGMGSVLCLWGEPGDLVVSLTHLKQPVEEIGPFDVLHDNVHGRTTVHDHTDLEQLLASTAAGLTCKDAARLIFSKDDPKANDIEKARRRLEALVGRNRSERRDDPDGLARYFTKAGD